MTFGAPLGLLALLAIPALVGAYFLRRRQPPRTVSAIFLWRSPDLRAESGPRLSKFSRELSLALEILAVLFAALFLADVQWGSALLKSHQVIVVDGSLSMNALVDRHTAADRVKTEIARLVETENVGSLTIIESGLKPTLLAGPEQEVSRALAALEAWKPLQPAHEVLPALQLAHELSNQQRVFYFTDGPQSELPAFVEAHSVGKSADNVAIVSAQRRDENGLAQLTVRVGNFSEATSGIEIVFTSPDAAVQKQQLTLGPQGSVVVRASMNTNQPVQVDLPSDALSEDGHLTLLPSPLVDINVGVVEEGLAAAALLALKRVVTVTPGLKFGEPAHFVVGPPSSTAKFRIGATPPFRSLVGPFFAQKGSPLLDDVQLSGVQWTAGTNPPGQILLSAGEVVLMSEESDGTVHLNLEMNRSNVQRTAAWPVLFGNMVRQVRLAMPGFPRRHLMLGEETPVVTDAQSTWKLQGPQGQSPALLQSGLLTLPPLSPGTWRLMKDGKPFDSMEVLAVDPIESDLRKRGPWDVVPEKSNVTSSFANSKNRSWWALGLVLCLVLVDFWLTATPRRKELAL